MYVVTNYRDCSFVLEGSTYWLCVVTAATACVCVDEFSNNHDCSFGWWWFAESKEEKKEVKVEPIEKDKAKMDVIQR